MGWKGNLRTAGAIMRQMERDARRRERELERRRKASEKLAALEQAELDVEEFENYLERVTTLHWEASHQIEWREVLNQSPPEKPSRKSAREEEAINKLNNFKPGLLTKMLGKVEARTEELRKSVSEGRCKDDEIFKKELKQYEDDLHLFESEVRLAEGVVSRKPESLRSAFEEFHTLEEIKNLGSSLDVRFFDDGTVHAKINVHGEDIIPDFSRSLLASGRLSEKKMPKGQFYELYQDYVCSVVLRLGREVLAVLPVDGVVVTAVDDLLNSSTGHMEEQPILSVYLPRETVQKLKFEKLDPSDAMKNFIHQMDFKKTKGFQPVEVVQIPSAS